MIKCAELTRTGIGLPAYYNDEVIIPSLESRGLTLQDARDYNIIGCVEPQKSGKTEGWHDAAFYNMLRPLELVFSRGMDTGVPAKRPSGVAPVCAPKGTLADTGYKPAWKIPPRGLWYCSNGFV